MTYLKRFLWLAAWSVWLWLGVGLYRELPRDLGPVVCRPELRSGEQFEGFERNSPTFLTKTIDSNTASPFFRRRSQSTGEIEREHPAEIPESENWRFTAVVWHNVVVGSNDVAHFKDRSKDEARREIERITNDVHILDLRSGKWHRFTDLGSYVECCASRPWLLFHGTVDHGAGERFVVLDVEANRVIYELKTSPGAIIEDQQPSFIGDLLAVPVGSEGKEFRTEIRTIPSGEVVDVLETHRNHLGGSSNGRVVVENWGRNQVGVRDIRQKKRLIDLNAANPQTFRGGRWGATISRDGRRLVWPTDGVVVDLDSGRTVWKANRFERLLFIDWWNQFQVAEIWTPFDGLAERPLTHARRSADDGSFVYRTWQDDSFAITEDRSLAYRDGIVYALPPRVNWWLLAGCETFLAVPIVGAWWLARRRKKRTTARTKRERLEPAQESLGV